MRLISNLSRLVKPIPIPTALVVGLGNRGREFRNNRHNAGFMVVDALCRRWSVAPSRLHCRALVAATNIEGVRVVLAKPQTYMNLSGQAVMSLLKFYKVNLEQMLVIHDDIDLPLGTIRLRPSGGAGGQKGLVSIIQQLGTQQFPRLRVGVGRPPGQMDAAAYVLRDFGRSELDTLDRVLERAAQAAETFVTQGLQPAMNGYNGGIDED